MIIGHRRIRLAKWAEACPGGSEGGRRVPPPFVFLKILLARAGGDGYLIIEMMRV